MTAEQLFTRFITERRYLKNISPQTEYSYNTVRKAHFKLYGADCELPAFDKNRLTDWIVKMRQGNVSINGCNVYIRTTNAFLHWLFQEQLVKERIKLQLLKEDRPILKTLTAHEIKVLIGFQPSRHWERRIHCLALCVLDTGLRCSEILSLLREDVNFDDLVIRVKRGKGGKGRIIPFSYELRKFLWRYFVKIPEGNTVIVFGTKNHTHLSIRNCERDLKKLGQQLGFHLRPHMLRHSFATEFLKRGGDIFSLSRILGHQNITTTQRYLHLLTEDLQNVHRRVSILSR